MALSRFRNRLRQHDEMALPVMPVRNLNWGTTVELVAPDVIGTTILQSQDLVDVALPDTEAGPWAITLAGPQDSLLVPAGGFPLTRGLQAEVTWGTGGAANTARCDWVRGQVLSLFSGRVRVKAIWESIVTNAVARNMQVGAFAAQGAPHGHRPAQLTNFMANLVPLGADTVEVPILARRLFLLGLPVNVPYNVDFLSPTGAQICNYVVAAYPGDGLLIPNGSRWVTITNGGAVICNPRLIWELDL